MQETVHDVAKIQVGRAMLEGHSWREAVHAAGLRMSRATAYRLRQRLLAGGEAAWHDRRQGHASKVHGAARAWLEGYYQQHPRAPGKAVQALLEAHGGVRISVTHLNRVRAVLTRATCAGEKSHLMGGRMGPVVSTCWRQSRRRISSRCWRQPCQRRRVCPHHVDWRKPPPVRDGPPC